MWKVLDDDKRRVEEIQKVIRLKMFLSRSASTPEAGSGAGVHTFTQKPVV